MKSLCCTVKESVKMLAPPPAGQHSLKGFLRTTIKNMSSGKELTAHAALPNRKKEKWVKQKQGGFRKAATRLEARRHSIYSFAAAPLTPLNKKASNQEDLRLLE